MIDFYKEMKKDDQHIIDRMISQGIITQEEVSRITESNMITFRVLARLGLV